MQSLPPTTPRHVWSRYLRSCALLLCLFLFAAPRAHATIGVAWQMLLGNPSNATADTNNHHHYLLQREIETIDYSDALRQPNWASWNYTTADDGSATRSSVFFTDTNLPSNFYWVLPTDLSGSGYDRGHMCPSADRKDTDAHNDQTFFMSNIIPQSQDNNQGIWANLENYSRTLASPSNEVLVICGPEGFGSNVTDSAGQIPIASNVWKIIVVVPPGAATTLDRISETTRVITVNIPNIQGIRTAPWQNYLTSVNQLQTNTSFTFFSALSPDLADVLRARVDGAPACGIINFTPTTGSAGETVVITGTNFTGATIVRFNGQNATFTLDSSYKITATVPAGASTGPLSVIAAGGVATSAYPFTVNTITAPETALAIELSSNGIVLSWPTNVTGFELQQNPDLNPTNWTSYTGDVTMAGTNKTATITTPEGRMFFRLQSH